MKLKEISKEERPRERLKKHGPSVMSNSELLAILLGQGSKKENVLILSNKIISEYNLDTLSQLKIEELQNISGIGEAKACKIISCFELGRRLARFSPDRKRKINSSKDIEKLYLSKMNHLKKENFKVLYLNSRKTIIKEETIFIGSLNSSIVHPREIFSPAINQRAAAIILMHNHPSGDPTPSKEDIEITKQLISSGKILGIETLDHVIIGKNKIYSLRDKKPNLFD